jgi:hypothetical protein
LIAQTLSLIGRAANNVAKALLPPRNELPAGGDYGAGQAPGPNRGGIPAELKREGLPWRGPEIEARSEVGREVAQERLRSGPAGVVYPWFTSNAINDGSRETQTMRGDYRMMESDPNVSAAVKGLIFSVATQDLTITPAKRGDPASEMHAEFIRWNVTKRLAGGSFGLIWDMLSGGLRDGYSLLYKSYGVQRDGLWGNPAKWPLRQVKAVDVGNDAVPQTDSHRNVVGVLGLRYNAGVELSPSEFIYFRHCPSYNNPLGVSAFRCVWRAWKFTQAIWLLRGIASEKRTTPFIHGSYRTSSQKAQLEAMLAKVSSQNWASLPEGVLLKALDIAQGSEEHYKSVIGDLQELIYLGIQHGTLQALTGGEGEERGNSKVHKSQTDLVRTALSKMVEACLNDYEAGWIRECIDLNFPDADDYPVATLGNPSVEELIQLMQLYKGLQELGLKLGKDRTYEQFAIQPPESDDDVLEPAAKEQTPVPGLPGPGAPSDDVQPPEPEPVGGGVKHAA